MEPIQGQLPKMNWKQKFLAVGIAVVFFAFVFYGIRTFTPQPVYDQYCNNTNTYVPENMTQKICEELGGRWNANYYPKPAPVETRANIPLGYCDMYYTCNKAYESENNKYMRGVFFIALIAGAIGLLIGLFISVGAVSAGLMAGGIFSMFYGIMTYWSNLGDVVRFVLIGVVLLILIWVGYKKMR
ncbi:hypothetical protein HZB02_06965 [Candidatus Woesearchaeota archaeon]|nr:hypothetical protein [Candidatus Woesearchaeota archaeon]